jgi:WD40 repeat protein
VVWDIQSGKILGKITVPFPRGDIALSPNRKCLAIVTRDDEPALVVFDLATEKELCRCKGHRGGISSLAFSPDGKSLFTGSYDLTAKLWDAESGKERWSYRGHTVNFYWVAVAFSPDGKNVGVAGWDGNVRLLDVNTGKERVPCPGHIGGIHGTITPDGKGVITTSEDQSLRLWEIATGKEVRVVKKPSRDEYVSRRVVHAEENVSNVVVTPDGKTMIVAGRQGVGWWDLNKPQPPAGADLIAGRSAAISPDGKTLAILTGTKLRLVDVTTKKVLREVEAAGTGPINFSPDGRTLAIACPKDSVRLYDSRSLQETAFLDAAGVQVTGRVIFSPDSQLVAACGMDWRVNIWEVASGQLRRRIPREKSMIDAIAFRPPGRYLAFGGYDRTVALYDVTTGQFVHTFRGHDGAVTMLSFTPDGARLVSGSADTTGLVWDTTAIPAPKIVEVKRTTKELECLWDQLASDAGTADTAMRTLAASPSQAVDLVGRSLKPAKKGLADVPRWINELDSDDFDERERASANLAELGEDAADALREALANKPSAELRRRAEELLKRLKSKVPSPERLRGLRAVELLEWIGTPEAQRALAAIATGAPDAERTRVASAALTRLKNR